MTVTSVLMLKCIILNQLTIWPHVIERCFIPSDWNNELAKNEELDLYINLRRSGSKPILTKRKLFK